MPLPPSYLNPAETRELTNDEAASLLAFLQLVHRNGDGIVPSSELDLAIRSIDPAISRHFFVAVMTKRFAVMRPDLSFSVPLLIWCAQMSDRVGVAVHWAYTMMHYQRINGRPMTLDDWCVEFPYGPPTEAEMHRRWDAQKGSGEDGDNRIDGREAWAAVHTELS